MDSWGEGPGNASDFGRGWPVQSAVQEAGGTGPRQLSSVHRALPALSPPNLTLTHIRGAPTPTPVATYPAGIAGRSRQLSWLHGEAGWAGVRGQLEEEEGTSCIPGPLTQDRRTHLCSPEFSLEKEALEIEARHMEGLGI